MPANRSTAERPPLHDYAADTDIAKLWRDRDVYGRPQAIARELTPGERKVVERRRDELAIGCSAFTPAELDRVIVALGKMFQGFRSMRRDDEETVVATLEGLRDLLQQFPLWAIEAGCLLIRKGKAEVDGELLSKKYAVHDPEIYAVVEGLVKEYQTKLAKAEALLRAPVLKTGA